MAANNIPQWKASGDWFDPQWKASGDWFDVCKCNIPCPCEFAQTPTYGVYWHIISKKDNMVKYHLMD